MDMPALGLLLSWLTEIAAFCFPSALLLGAAHPRLARFTMNLTSLADNHGVRILHFKGVQ